MTTAQIRKEVRSIMDNNPTFKLTKKYLRENYPLKKSEVEKLYHELIDPDSCITAEAVSKGLTEQEKVFCLEYLKSYNLKHSCIKAGYTHREGFKLLDNELIKEELRRLQHKKEDELYVSAKNIVQMYLEIAFADMTDFITFGSETVPMLDGYGREICDNNGDPITINRNFIKLKDSAHVDGKLIQEVRQSKDGVSIKLFDKMVALEKLSKLLNVEDVNTLTQLRSQLLKAQIQVEENKAKVLDNTESDDMEIVIRRASKNDSGD